MTPEQKAREEIDRKLVDAGWVIQDMKQLNLGAGMGVAVREYPTDTGPADYVLFVNRNAVGVIEAKKDAAGENLTVVEDQTVRYATANLKWRKDSAPLRFLFEATGQIIRFTDNADPAPRSREIFYFFKPETLAAWVAQPPLLGGAPSTLRRRLADHMPVLPERNLRDCQISAVTGLEKSLALNKPRALVHMATGAGKTFTAITSVYRLLKFGGAKRILFLMDTRNLGKQAHQEFMAYTPPVAEQKIALAVLEERLQAIRELELPTELGLKQSAAQRQNILKAAFSGQLVAQDPSDEPASELLARIRAERAAQQAIKKPRGRKVKEAA